MQMLTTSAAGELRSAVLDTRRRRRHRCAATPTGNVPSAGGAAEARKERVKSTANGRAAALKAMGKEVVAII